jgi:branched-chain amino acid transport system substrate-binding protein
MEREGSRWKQTLAIVAVGVLAFSVLVATTSAKPSATKAPILIGTDNDVQTGGAGTSWGVLNSTINAAVAAVNKAGGIKGRPLQIVACDPQANAVTGQQCAQKFISEKVVAVCCSFSTTSGTVMNPVLENAGIANFGQYASGGADYTSTNVFATGGASVLWGSSAGPILKRKGVKKVFMVYLGIAAGQSLKTIVQTSVNKAGLTWVGDTSVTPSTLDMTQAVATAMSAGADAVVTGTTEPQGVQFYSARKQLGGKFLVLNQGFGAFNVTHLDRLLDGNINPNPFPPAQRGYIKHFPALKQYFDEMAAAVKAGDKNASPYYQNPAQTLRSWSSVHQLAWVLRAMNNNNINSTTVLAKLKTIKKLPTYGFGPALDLTKTYLPNYPRVFYTNVYENSVNRGHYVLVNPKPVNTAPIINGN